MTDDVIHQTYVYSDISNKYWKITKPVTVELSNKEVITIPKGFYYDMASVPKFLWSIVRPFNDGLLATLIHDYLYVHRKPGWTRAKVDKEYLKWMNQSNSNKLDNYVRYIFVRVFGWAVWKKIVNI